MIQFSQSEVQAFREKFKKENDILDVLLEKTKTIRTEPLRVPDKGIANWSHYYFCSDCSVGLIFDLNQPFAHKCPTCGKIHTGEPFDSTWWGNINTLNSVSAYDVALMYLLTEDTQYSTLVKNILLAYAQYYPDYAVHGNIPYNGPGKACAQTLTEAVFMRHLAYAYDLIESSLTDDEKETICSRLLRPAGEFLRDHRHNQIHNHEVIIDACIGILGLILQDEALIDFAVYQDYGLLYQLEHGMLEDGCWFECSTSYHFFAIQNFFGFERFAQHTKHSQLNHPNYRKMICMPLSLAFSDGSFPILNDGTAGQLYSHTHELFEFAYKLYQDPALLYLLYSCYKKHPRLGIDSFFYGVDTLPACPDYVRKDFHHDYGCGNTVLRGKNDSYFLFRHGPFGGEHDHYDRLAIAYYYANEPVYGDFGTTGYGAYYHYAYFKNTGTHNTVCINGANQPPQACKVTHFEQTDAFTKLSAMVSWQTPYKMPDSFTICQWDDEAYKNVTMNRQLVKAADYLVDVFTVEGAGEKQIDWLMHFGGKRTIEAAGSAISGKLGEADPYKHIVVEKEVAVQGEMLQTTYTMEKAQTTVFSYLDGAKMIYANGPSNPTSAREEYMIQRTSGNRVTFINVIATGLIDAPSVTSVTTTSKENKVTVTVTLQNTTDTHTFNV